MESQTSSFAAAQAGCQTRRSQMYHFGERFFDPALGQWTQGDTLTGAFTNPFSLNRLSYANGNPANYVDSSGRSYNVPFSSICDLGDQLRKVDKQYLSAAGQLADGCPDGIRNAAILGGVLGFTADAAGQGWYV